MKTKGVCPKCSSDEILTVPGTIGAFGAGNNVPLGWRAVKAVPVTRFVCGANGYCEEWLVDPEDLGSVRKKNGCDAAQQRDAEHNAKDT